MLLAHTRFGAAISAGENLRSNRRHIQAEAEPGEGGETDVAGVYALVMLHARKIFGDGRYLDEAMLAAERLDGRGFGIADRRRSTIPVRATRYRKAPPKKLQRFRPIMRLRGYDTDVKRLSGSLAIVFACAMAYEWFVVEAIVSEAIAALAVGIAVLLVHGRLVRVAPPNARVSLAFVRPFVQRVLPGVVRESFDLLGPTLWRGLVRREAVRGRWIALRYDPGDPGTAEERGRRTVTIVGSNLTPNALPLDIDERAGRIVLHQLVARREDAAGDSRYPM